MGGHRGGVQRLRRGGHAGGRRGGRPGLRAASGASGRRGRHGQGVDLRRGDRGVHRAGSVGGGLRDRLSQAPLGRRRAAMATLGRPTGWIRGRFDPDRRA